MRELKIQTKTKRNIFLVIFGIFGVFISSALMPETRISLEIPDAEEMITDPSLPLPPVGPRDEGFNPLDEPFLFQLGSTDKMTGKEREDILDRQYHDIVHNLTGIAPVVSVDQSSGMTVVKIGEVPFATVLPVDAPE